ncbi:hypothetical protein ABZ635_19450 [Nocardiopsis sp. NPDC007018]|uniref:hypothetical protein n=1 Tax=Nocardiopsis sp. NPDC007018 TaxID=3155721 RepID=UPI00340DD3F8
MILNARGAVIATSTRPDNLTATPRARDQVGPVAVFDPQRPADGVPARWPLMGHADLDTAHRDTLPGEADQARASEELTIDR